MKFFMKISILLLFILIIQPNISVAEDIFDDSEFQYNDDQYIMVPSYRYKNEEKDILFEIYNRQDWRETNIMPCDSLPLLLNSCTKSFCVLNTKFGKVYKKVVGMYEGKCIYLERTQKMGGMNCELPKDNLKKYEFLFSEKDFELLGFGNMFIEDHQDLRDVYLNFCKPLKNQNVSPIKFIAGEEISDVNIGFLGHELENEVQKEEGVVDDNVEEDIDLPTLIAKKSISFSEIELNLIESAYNEFKYPTITGKTTKSALAALGKEGLKSFYLNSIMYLNDAQWSLWLNNFKFSSGQSHPSIKIIRITPEYVVLRWASRELDIISPNWRKILETQDEVEYFSATGNISVRQEGESLYIVEFRLEPNQNFEISNMTIIEGKLK